MRLSTVTMQQQGVNAILDKQVSLTNTELQLATGRKILRPSDDPANSSLILNLKESIGIADQHIRNADMAQTSLSFSESASEGVVNNIQRVRELTVQALNDTNTPENRAALAMEVRQIRAAIFNLANTRDAQGEYIFSGSKTTTQPFSVATGADPKSASVTYNGNSTQKQIQIGVGQKLTVRDPGQEVFGPDSFQVGTTVAGQDIKLKTTATSGTTETAISMTAGMTVDDLVAAINAETTNTKVQAVNDNGKLLLTTTDGTADAPTEVVITDGTTAGGLQNIGVTGSGDPKSFTTQPDLFKAIDNIADQLESGTITSSTLLDDLDAGLNRILKIESKIGSRINMIERHVDTEKSFIAKMKETLANVNDLDYAEAIAKFNIDRVGMQAAQQAYIKIQGLSLFEYLR